MKLCERCKVLGCGLDYLGPACKWAREQECPNVQPNNAEIITNMDIGELSEFLMDVSMGLLIDKGIVNVKEWLSSTHEEG